ncbi:twin-arginine translocation protein, TatC [Aeropyrum pernix K1]|uniref:Twin-arginine translocation protein, TatC n=1 Tax=Aeropyrum pernix (strain ATCC 700893 / DSM 11879 / JCM 9820 / NBRC 100138 / K1) TaxID=272557 RepID=Q9Y9Y5_AERPE|nr:Sec-independent protein translocase TatC [Aeropyrum pernix]BAA81165.2 twin-arginine translocation protein, TatC [Aeropyrum pernix K1]
MGAGAVAEEERVEENRDIEADVWFHVQELIMRLRKVAIAFAVASIIVPLIPVSIAPYVPLLTVFTKYFINSVVPSTIDVLGYHVEVRLIQTSPFAGLSLLIKTALLMGLLVVSPLLAYELYAFIKPALYPHEDRFVRTLGPIAVGLFMFGALIAFKVILPLGYAISFVTSVVLVGDKLVAFADVNNILQTSILVIVGVGLLYETPVLLYGAVRAGLVSPNILSGDKGRMVLLGLLALGAVISPDGTGLGMLVLTLPLFAALKLAVWFGAKSRKSGEALAGTGLQP